MNETKRQLDQLMGDTTEKTERVMAMVEQKKNKRSTSKKKVWMPIFSTVVTVAALLALFFIINPFNNESEVPGEEQEQPLPNAFDEYRSLFKKHGDVAYFAGEGNEYASFVETTEWLSESYVSVATDNGGAITQNIYRITNEKLSLILQAEVEEPKLDYTLEQLESFDELDIVFEGQIVDGERKDGSIITTGLTVETPYKTFTEVISVKQPVDDATTEQFYVQGYGLIGKIFTAENGQQVISLLEKLEEEQLVTPPVAENTLQAYRSLFKPDGTLAHFQGDGIEFSTYDEKTIWIGESYVIVRVDNGGSIFDRIFRLTEEKLTLIGQQVVDTMDDSYSVKELDAMEEIEVLFEGPIEEGTAPNGDEIFTGMIIETPYKTFADVIVTQRTEDDGSVNETYYYPGYGIVGTRFTSPDGYQVMSLLETLSNTQAKANSSTVTFHNNTTNERESLPREQLTFINPAYTAQQIEQMGISYGQATETAAGEIGLFSYECGGQNCGYSIVLRNGDRITKTYFSSKGVEIPTVSYGPMHPYILPFI